MEWATFRGGEFPITSPKISKLSSADSQQRTLGCLVRRGGRRSAKEEVLSERVAAAFSRGSH